jgi:UDP-N-acetyl-D-mannosaminuronic acid dehydrogenase
MECEGKFSIKNWRVEKIAVVGAGIVGVPMAAVLARARICQGSDNPSRVVVIQRDSPTSGWKVNAINAGKSPIGGIEPELDRIVADAVQKGLLSASHDYSELSDADVILVCVQTDKEGFSPDYEPMFEALSRIAPIIQKKHNEKVPLIIIESTLAPSSLLTLIREQFTQYGLEDGREILLGHSPNRVMPGYLVERIISSDKVIGGLNPATPKFIQTLYSKIVTKGDLFLTNGMTAEIVKTLENAYRDVRIAFTAEIGRYCDAHDIDFYLVREKVNNRLARSDVASENPNAVPTGGLLIPTIGVGGHCLPKDGVLLLWRQIEAGGDMSKSLILEARRINDESPHETVRLAEKNFGNLSGQAISLMGTAYRFNSEDTRNSPTLALARLLLQKGCRVIMHDPFVKTDDQNLLRFDLQKYFTQDLNRALEESDYLIFCTAHKIYQDEIDHIMKSSESLKGIFDGCNLFSPGLTGQQLKFAGIGKGKNPPKDELIDFVFESFRAVEQGFANEIQRFIDFANERYARDDFNRVDFSEVQQIAGTCITGCQLVNPGTIRRIPDSVGLSSRLVKCAE